MTDKNNTGALFKNDRKDEGEKRPDYTGICNIGGKNYYISAWISESRRDGQKYMSLAFRERIDFNAKR